MLREAMAAVKEFHIHKNIDFTQRMAGSPLPDPSYLMLVSDMHNLSKRALERFHQNHDFRWLRIHLLLEERAELLTGLCNGDEVSTLDALCDDMYVTIGTALTFQLPLSEAFAEVHRSNMSKRVSSGVEDPRLQVKGDSYSPPDLRRILQEARR